MPTQSEITITYHGCRVRFDAVGGSVIVGDASIVDDCKRLLPTQIKGFVGNDEELQSSQSYRLWGHWSEYRGQRQFAFKTFAVATPHSRAGIVTYLDGAPGLGRALSVKLYDAFGADAVAVLRESPDRAANAIKGLSADVAAAASEWLAARKAIEDSMIDVMELLDGRGFRKSTAKAAIKMFGSKAPELIRRNPYLLRLFPGVGFKLCDKLYLDLGGRCDRLKRQSMCATHAIESDSSGSTWHYFGVAEKTIEDQVSGGRIDAAKAIRLAHRARTLACRYTDGIAGALAWSGDTLWLAEQRKARNESRLARLIAKAALSPPWPDAPLFANDTCTAHQVEALIRATSIGSVGILGGSPGTGKTYTVAQYIKLLALVHGLGSIAVCAPTGKAAVRISEAMAACGINVRARTIHSLLGVQQVDGGNGWAFERNESNPLDERFVIVDESSMVDADLMAALLAARGRGTFILFVGDVNQLPPVGHGAPLRDLILAGVPYGELTEIKRQSNAVGGIVQACADMRDGKPFDCVGDLHHVAASNPDAQIESLLKLLNEASIDCDPVWDCQILVAVNRKSPLSRRELNKRLQRELNPNHANGDSPFWLADKVVNTKNRFYPPAGGCQKLSADVAKNEAGELYVANGELGRVVRIEKKYIEVALTGPERLIRVPRGSEKSGDDSDETGTGCDWDLAYALSVHKSQGSEWPIAIVMVDEYPGARRICDRAWLYTAISRAKQHCYLVGRIDTAQRFTRTNNISSRKTFLRELIEQEINKQSAWSRGVPAIAVESKCEGSAETHVCQC